MKIVPIVFLLLVSVTCRKDEPLPPHNHHYVPSVQLAVVDTGVVDITLKVTFLDTAVHRTFTVKRDSIMLGVTPAVSGLDTTVLDGALQPNHKYHYTLYRTLNGQNIDSSKVQVTTMDTTSHNFTWQMDTFGDGGSSSSLYDVAIINDTDVWAVGEVYLNDSTGHIDPHPYNLARWNGTQWNLSRIYFPVCGTSSSFPAPARAIFAFNANDIWIASGGTIARWDGTSFSTMCIPSEILPGSINRLWGQNSNDVYVVANRGTIVHYNGITWSKIESGTTVSINDIWGTVDAKTGKPFILAAASNVFENGEKRLLHITEQFTIDTVYSSTDRIVYSVWYANAYHLYISGGGVFTRNPKYVWRELVDLNTIPYFTDHIRGHRLNDIFVVGDFGVVAHYNGATLKIYTEVNSPDRYKSVAYNGSTMVSVGIRGSQAVILRMYR